jgi:hypothetical protein
MPFSMQPKRVIKERNKTHEMIGTKHLHDLERATHLPSGLTSLMHFFYCARRAHHLP